MKILFISDIHGITKNLDKIKKLEEQHNFDKIVNLGDIYHCGLSVKKILKVNPNAVKEFLTKYRGKLLTIRGNCDADVDIQVSDFPICNDLVLINTDGLNIYCTHGDKYNIDNNTKINDLNVLIYGHFHIPYIKKDNNKIYVCVGSVSLPRDSYGPTYAIYENKKIAIYSLNSNEEIMQIEI